MAGSIRRDESRSVPEQELQEIFSTLLVLRSKTDPRNGPSSMVNKHRHAIEAMDLSMILVRGLSVWAFAQLAGAALTLSEPPNSHAHENTGRSISKRDILEDPKRYRI